MPLAASSTVAHFGGVRRQIARAASIVVLASAGDSCGGSKSPSAPPPLTGLSIQLSTTSTTQNTQVPFQVNLPPAGVPAGAVFLLELSFNGSRPAIDSTTVPDGATGFTATLNIPSALPDGTITLTAVLPQQRDSTSAYLVVKDSVPPTFGSTYVVPATAPHIAWDAISPFLTTTTSNDTLVFGAVDNHEVAWLGYTLGPPANVRDSIAVNDSSGSWHATFSLPASLAGTAPEIGIFAVNADGYRSEIDSVGALMIGQHVRRPVATAAVDASVRRLLYDAKRNVVYVPQPDQPSIAVLSLASMTYQSPIALPAAPNGLDITPSGDTLVVTLLNTADVAFVDLTSGTLLATTHLGSLDVTPGDTTQQAWLVGDVRVAGDGLILVPICANAPGAVNCGLAQLRRPSLTDSIVSTGAYWSVKPARSSDGAKVMLLGVWAPVSGTTSVAAIYDAVAHAYVLIPPAPQRDASIAQWSAVSDQTGSHYLLGEYLVDGMLQSLGAVGPYRSGFATIWGATISPSASDAYVSVGTGPAFYLRFRLGQPVAGLGGQLVEAVDAPDVIRDMWITPDEHWLIALGLSTVMRFDLTQSTPVGAARVLASRVRRNVHPTHDAHSQPWITFAPRLRQKH